jgi:hypothetical protein
MHVKITTISNFNRMKKSLFTLALMMTAMCIYAQPGARGEMMREHMESQRVAFMTQKLALTPDESAKFWPLYNAYRDQQQKLRLDARADQRAGELSEADAEKLIESQFSTEENMLKLKREYYGKFKSAIPASKIARLSHVEMEFNRNVLEKIRDRREDRRN